MGQRHCVGLDVLPEITSIYVVDDATRLAPMTHRVGPGRANRLGSRSRHQEHGRPGVTNVGDGACSAHRAMPGCCEQHAWPAQDL
jgi:hypothetical protein